MKISEKDIAKGKMVGVARIELATPAMSTQCSTTELYAHAAPASSWAWYIIQAYFILSQLSLANRRSTSRTRSLRWKGLARILAFGIDAPARRATPENPVMNMTSVVGETMCNIARVGSRPFPA
jgi:hypothetical protein